ncbi:hypothetical protein HY839_00570 [Candidatus Azambacteria bacterium]|nr:hypothetical protein [Candidatus Azambacteria bacterium]
MEHLFVQLLIVIMFLAAVFLHVVKKNSTAAVLYCAQSAAMATILLAASIEADSRPLLFVALATFAVKTLIAPLFFAHLIKRHQLKFSASTYLSVPLTLIAVAALTALTRSHIFAPLVALGNGREGMLSLALAMMLISLFLIVNRKGAISQMIGILSLENSIVAFAVFAGLEQAPGLQMGIMFDILVWVVVATVFTSMMYKQFGSLDVTAMQRLKE